MTNSYSLKIWVHPTTGAKRIYINGGMLNRSDKLFIVAAKNIAGQDSWEARLSSTDYAAYAPYGLGNTSIDIASAIAMRALDERILTNKSFAQIVEAI